MVTICVVSFRGPKVVLFCCCSLACARPEALKTGEFKWSKGADCFVGALLTRATVGPPVRPKWQEWTVWRNCGNTHHFEGLRMRQRLRKIEETGMSRANGCLMLFGRRGGAEEWEKARRFLFSMVVKVSISRSGKGALWFSVDGLCLHASKLVSRGNHASGAKRLAPAAFAAPPFASADRKFEADDGFLTRRPIKVEEEVVWSALFWQL